MEAIVEIAGFQYKVQEGDTIKTQKLDGEIGNTKEFPVLLLQKEDKTLIGDPYLKNVKCKAEIIGSGKSKKILVYKYKRRKRYRRLKGHRQLYTELSIISFSKETEKPPTEKPKKESKKKLETKKPLVKKPKKVTKKKVTIKKSPAEKSKKKTTRKKEAKE